MKEHCVDLSSLTPHGKIESRQTDGAFEFWTTRSMTPVSYNLYGDSYRGHYVSIPGKFKLPFRIDMTVKIDFPACFLFIGDGHISFASPWQDNRKIEDIAVRSGKPNQDHGSFDNSLPYGKYADVSVTYNPKEMQILVDGEERFYSGKQAYMKAKNFAELNSGGFSIGLAVTKRSVLSVKSMTVTEFDGQAPVTRGNFKLRERAPDSGDKPKATFENIVAGLPSDIRYRALETDEFLKSLKPMKFKRTVDKNGGRISYVASDFGFSYGLTVSGAESTQNFGWYIVTGGKPETWHQKADYLEEALDETAESDERLAGRIFFALNDCVGCYGSRCLAKRPYEFKGEKRLSCHGRVLLHTGDDDYRDVREFITRLNAMLERKLAGGGFVQEKIYVKK